MTEVELLEKIVLEDIDLYHVKPEYIKKLENIKKEGTVPSDDFEKKFGLNFEIF